MTDIAGISAESIAALAAAPTLEEMEANQLSVKLLAEGVAMGADMTHPDVVVLQDSVNEIHARMRASLAAAREVGQTLAAMTDDEKYMLAADASAQIVELVTGYKNRWLANGFSQGMAEYMAMQFHGAMVSGNLGAPGQ